MKTRSANFAKYELLHRRGDNRKGDAAAVSGHFMWRYDRCIVSVTLRGGIQRQELEAANINLTGRDDGNVTRENVLIVYHVQCFRERVGRDGNVIRNAFLWWEQGTPQVFNVFTTVPSRIIVTRSPISTPQNTAMSSTDQLRQYSSTSVAVVLLHRFVSLRVTVDRAAGLTQVIRHKGAERRTPTVWTHGTTLGSCGICVPMHY